MFVDPYLNYNIGDYNINGWSSHNVPNAPDLEWSFWCPQVPWCPFGWCSFWCLLLVSWYNYCVHFFLKIVSFFFTFFIYKRSYFLQLHKNPFTWLAKCYGCRISRSFLWCKVTSLPRSCPLGERQQPATQRYAEALVSEKPSTLISCNKKPPSDTKP